MKLLTVDLETRLATCTLKDEHAGVSTVITVTPKLYALECFAGDRRISSEVHTYTQDKLDLERVPILARLIIELLHNLDAKWRPT